MDNSKATRSTAAALVARIGCIVAATLCLGIGSAAAAPGDVLGTVSVPQCPVIPGSDPEKSLGTGLDFDGTNLILSCWGSNVLQLVTPAGQSAGSRTIANVTSLGALSWDPGRGKLWACDLSGPGQRVVLIDLATQAVVANPAPFAVPGCAYGIAYDADDGTLWTSDSSGTTVSHYTVAGAPLAAFNTDTDDMFEGYPNSGVVVACGKLYVSNFGGNGIYQVPKTFASSNFFQQIDGAQTSDMAHDTKTFAGKGAIWVLDAFVASETRTLTALEIETCGNTPPVCTAAKADPAELWPPNHKYVKIGITGVTDADGDSIVISATSIYQDELVQGNGLGSGNTDPDATLAPVQVRAERNGNPKTPGNGRVYHINFTATDGNGGSCTGQVLVCVPHDQGSKKPDCIDGGPLYDSTKP